MGDKGLLQSLGEGRVEAKWRDPWRGCAPFMHCLQISSPGETAHFWELCRREGQLLECRAISSTWVGSLPPVCPHPPQLGTPRHRRDEISFPGLIQPNVNESLFTLPRTPLIMNVPPSSSFIYQKTCSLTDGVRGNL